MKLLKGKRLEPEGQAGSVFCGGGDASHGACIPGCPARGDLRGRTRGREGGPRLGVCLYRPVRDGAVDCFVWGCEAGRDGAGDLGTSFGPGSGGDKEHSIAPAPGGMASNDPS